MTNFINVFMVLSIIVKLLMSCRTILAFAFAIQKKYFQNLLMPVFVNLVEKIGRQSYFFT